MFEDRQSLDHQKFGAFCMIRWGIIEFMGGCGMWETLKTCGDSISGSFFNSFFRRKILEQPAQKRKELTFAKLRPVG